MFTTMLAIKDRHQMVYGSAFSLAQLAKMSELEVLEGLKVLEAPDTKRIEKQITTLAQRLYDGLSSLNLTMVSPEEPSQRSGVISFTTDNPEAHYKRLTEKGYVLSLRPAGIRVSTGFFNTAEEIDGLIDETMGLVG
ncbi:hypothetical protein MUP51_08555 [Candidatus Bathyarchaeota archaeon]|nr:hypothetical protein [Candidatus Bathyarchaeota archaeon]